MYERGTPNLVGLKLAVVQKRMASIGPIQQSTTSSASSNLLRLVDPKLDAVSGTWKTESSGLGLDSPGFGLVRVLYAPPAEYDLTVTFTRRQYHDFRDLHIIVPRGLERFGVGIGRPIQKSYIDGADTNAGTDVNADAVLQDNRKYTVRIEVRKDKVGGISRQCARRKWVRPARPRRLRTIQVSRRWNRRAGLSQFDCFSFGDHHKFNRRGKNSCTCAIWSIPVAWQTVAAAIRVLYGRSICLPLIDVEKDLLEGTAQFDSNRRLISSAIRN